MIEYQLTNRTGDQNWSWNTMIYRHTSALYLKWKKTPEFPNENATTGT